jgi:hypothetical protein
MVRANFVSIVLSIGFCISGVGQTVSSPGEVTPQNDHVRITHGPVVENVTDTTAIIAWSTNVNAGTVLHYGTDPKHLDVTAGMPWGGLTHRVNLQDLKPATTYYYQAESPSGQGTGTSAATALASFQTKPGAQVREGQKPGESQSQRQ